uniref:Galectin n=1 Tax=Pipistrellus kuhlii TaxID=59472 RepID=A0A7J7SN40_PIPKU|nr:Charcot-Leyden crystal galectin [Pipistrellus kuhlii]
MCQMWPTMRKGPAPHALCFAFSMSPELQVDFHTGTQEDSDIAFSFRVYFGNCVVMNSRQFGDWKSEEKYEGMPFVDGQPFELCISVLQNEYQRAREWNRDLETSMTEKH